MSRVIRITEETQAYLEERRRDGESMRALVDRLVFPDGVPADVQAAVDARREALEQLGKRASRPTRVVEHRGRGRRRRPSRTGVVTRTPTDKQIAHAVARMTSGVVLWPDGFEIVGSHEDSDDQLLFVPGTWTPAQLDDAYGIPTDLVTDNR